VFAVNAAGSSWGAVEGVAPLLLVEQGVQGLIVASDRVGVVQRQPRQWDPFSSRS
jgi:hypothetical protein